MAPMRRAIGHTLVSAHGAREIRQPLQKSGGNTREQSHLHLRKGEQQWQSSACR